MIDMAFKRLNSSHLIDIIYQFQLNVKELNKGKRVLNAVQQYLDEIEPLVLIQVYRE